MGELSTEIFEQHQAELLGKSYQELKAYFDENIRLFGVRYNTGSQYEKEWNTWCTAWRFQQSKIEQLENLLALQRHKVKALEVELTNSRNYSDKLHEKIHDAELQIAVHWGADEDTDSVLRDVEKALRGES